MKKMTRLAALLLALLMLLQCAVSAADGVEEAPEEPVSQELVDNGAEEVPEEPVDNGGEEVPEEPVDNGGEDVPPPAEPVEIEIETSLSDGQVVNNPNQSLVVTAGGNDVAVDISEIVVKCGDAVIEPTDGAFALSLAQGDNLIEITARTASVRLTVRYEIAIPDGWAHDALAFCVAEGILNGNQDGDLCPTDRASRAQLAAMLVRLFQAPTAADLSGYRDVSPEKWYYAEMARAVAMGIFEGSDGKLTPQQNITREQAFTVLARAFGVGTEDTAVLDKYPDSAKVSGWARGSLAAMLNTGFVHGNTDGTLNPKGYITRQELAQVLYNALDCITDDAAAIDGSHNLYTGPIDALRGRLITGDLILSVAVGQMVELDSFTVTGRLVLHLHDTEEARLGAVCSEVSVCSPVELRFDTPVEKLVCIRDGAQIHGDAATVISSADVAFFGNYDRVFLQGGNPIFAANVHAKTVDVAADMTGSNVAIFGSVDALHARPKGLHLSEDGHIGTLYQYYEDISNSCDTGKVVRRIDVGLAGVKVVPGSAPEVYYDNLTTTVTGKITGVNTTDVYGVPGGVRTVKVTYRYNGRIVKTDKEFKLTEGAVLSCTFDARLVYRTEALQPVSVTITYGDQTVTGELQFKGMGRFTYLHEARNVDTCHVRATALYTTSMYAYSSLSTNIGTLAAGTIVNFLKYENNGASALIETDAGKRAWVSSSAIQICWKTYHNDSKEYDTGTKEAFVNELHNYSSPTRYLIWCNLYTTTVNIFEGSKGNWKLIKSGECDIGACNSPTRPGVYSIYSKAYYWSFDTATADDVDRAYYASLFDGGIAFHTRLYYTGTHNLVDARLSCEISHGCVRCPDDIAQFIYNQCPYGTTVVVY